MARKKNSIDEAPLLPRVHSDLKDSPSNSSRSTDSAAQQSDMVFIKIVARIFIQLIKQFWVFSSAAIFVFLLVFWFLGGFVSFFFLMYAVTGLLYQASDRLLYFPEEPATSRVYVPSPATLGLPFENVYIQSKDKTKLHLYFIKCGHPEPGSQGQRTLLFLHGNAGNIGHRLINAKQLWQSLRCHVCLLEYRGYGHSDGSPSEEGLYYDAQAALDFLLSRSDVHPEKIFVFGRSLGGAVAIDLCFRPENRDKIAGLMVENTFTSIPEIAQVLFNFKVVRWIPTWFYKNKFASRSKMCRVTLPVLFLSGGADTLIPPGMMTDLYRTCGSQQKHFARFPTGTHNDTYRCPHYFDSLAYFMESLLQPATSSSSSPYPVPPSLSTTILMEDQLTMI